MRYIIVLIVWAVGFAAQAQDWEDQQRFGPQTDQPPLRVLSSTDTDLFAPVVDSFLAASPGVSIEYLVTSTASLDRIFRAAPDQYDVVISSAMDLQLKLANDGFARRLDGLDHPDWAEWRNSLFAFTQEPAAIVVNRAAFEGAAIPQTRQDLIETLRADPDRFRGRLGTYDVRQSGLGYLFATQDARASETYWRLMEVMGGLQTRLYCCSGDMIDDLADGSIAVAYNVLGSYAVARDDISDRIHVILPSDFPTTMMRTALVSGSTTQPDLAEAFVAHLISTQSQGGENTPLPPLKSGEENAGKAIITLEPALMTYLDAQKRRVFLREWENAMIQSP
ncbi:ABC transporter substrate-binding protein [Marivita sp. S6314]|uniref:ABC transporter substrate-binding protein n=1 Tax=Marivita sp. S6314 TaxID=2926406 RepID=UPI001FF1812A|nr:ABC transporter substrate-binding protein [Marivita sp. S6314]MCK0148476.1 ABC transporter substrate-binding protein [Marivita sp. S6314]